MISDEAFIARFAALTDHAPMPWQTAMFRRFVAGEFPDACDLPTGLGKTSTIPIWLIALTESPEVVPRRLVYVVNRRTVVDQATAEAEKLKRRLDAPAAPILAELAARLNSLHGGGHDSPLAISTLRGQYADNREWSADPSRAAVICGTVDMIGSRLLFSGCRCGFKSRPLHAGFLGQDVLLVHDEAHLEEPFQRLLRVIEREQARRGDSLKKFRAIELSATPRGAKDVFRLTDADFKHPLVARRLASCKRVELHPIDDEKKLPDALADRALGFADSGLPVLVFAQSVETVEKVVERLRKELKKNRDDRERVASLTGTMRGFERDALAKSPVFQRFLPPGDRPNPGDRPLDDAAVYLVGTSAGEVGVNISADHLVCDLTTFESMAQRFGRVNRFGDRTDTEIHVFHPMNLPSAEDVAKELEKPSEKRDPQVILNDRKRRTLELLRRLDGSGGPAALGKLPAEDRTRAFSPTPKLLPATSILFDAWAMTSIQNEFAGRPSVEPYLHGLSDYEPPRTSVAWREEVERLARLPEFSTPEAIRGLLDDYPLKPHELLSDRTERVFKQLQRIAERLGDAAAITPAWVLDADEEPRATTLLELVADDKEKLRHATVLLPPKAGGLAAGLLNGGEPATGGEDVADEWFADDRDESGERPRRRRRIWDDDEPPRGMRWIRTIDVAPESDEDEEAADPESEDDSAAAADAAAGRRRWHWYERPASGDADGSKTADADWPVTWDQHAHDVVAAAERIVAKLGLPADLPPAIALAARGHDLGKKRVVWQKSIGNPNPTEWLAKSGPRDSRGVPTRPVELSPYRHEFGSLLDLRDDEEFRRRSPETQELILHLVATHHGRARPHFDDQESFDPERPQRDANAIAAEIPLRFARLQRKYGRWGLAYLESLLRAADAAASARPTRPS